MEKKKINRRTFLKASLVGASALMYSACQREKPPIPTTKEGKPPNIVFILADDLGAWALGCAGNREIHTPNIDQLAREGIRFENFFCSTPVCSPARATILTGRIPSQHGIQDHIYQGNIDEDKAGLPPDKRVIPDGKDLSYLAGITAYTDILAANGYQCAHVGKWHLGDSTTPQKGNQFWVTMPYGSMTYSNDAIFANGEWDFSPGYTTRRLTNYAVDFLREHRDPERPFHLSLNYTAPHTPWYAESHPDYLRMPYQETEFKSIPDGDPHPNQRATAASAYHDPSYRRELLTGYFAAVSGMDQQLVRVINVLKEIGEWENTLIIFSGDNGINMGHHGVWGKGNATYPMNMYEESIKVPLIISGPLVRHRLQPEAHMLSQYDLFPTLLDYLGLAWDSSLPLPGRSFANILRGKRFESADRVYLYDEYGPVRMVRTREWKYIHQYGFEEGDILYDLKHDPGETTNLVNDPDFADVAAELRQQIADWFAAYMLPDFNGENFSVYGAGQIGIIDGNSSTEEIFREP